MGDLGLRERARPLRRGRIPVFVAVVGVAALIIPTGASAQSGEQADPPAADQLVTDDSVQSTDGSGPGSTSNAADDAAATETYETTDNRNARASAADFAAAQARARAKGSDQVIVGLQTTFTPEGAMDDAGQSAQRAEIARASDAVLETLEGTEHSVVHTYETVPYLAVRLSTGALKKLERSGQAASLQEDVPVPATLSGSGQLVEHYESHTVGRAGLGQHVAILDTGVQKAHLFLRQANGTPKVVSEACYSANAHCPGGVTASTATGSGEPCTFSKCDHGTHVAGIAAGRGTTSSGTAREANLISINIFSNISGCGTCTFTSDQIKGLERVNTLSSTYRIASVNMSIGGGKSTTNCDSDSRKPIIDTLRSKGIATVIASGNDGFTDGVSFPSCISTAITVGSSTKTDTVSSFSNSSPLVELLAPGSSITSSIPDSTDPKDAQASKSGTSMATPHVAGAWAVLRGISLSASVPTVLAALESTGKPLVDSKNNLSRPRIRVLSAGTRLADTGLRGAGSFSGTGIDMASGGVGLRASGSGTIVLSGIPAGATLINSKLIWTTLAGPDPSVTFNGTSHLGTLIGASKDTCWNINQLGPNRTYVRHLPTPLGNGSYAISGVGGVNGALAQGASLLTVYQSGSGVGRVYQRFGASSTVASTQAAFGTVLTTGSGVHVRRPAVLVSVGDGQSFTESALKYGNVAITSPDFFPGLKGTYWDDERVPISTSLIPSGTVARSISVNAGGDCLVMTAASVSYATTS